MSLPTKKDKPKLKAKRFNKFEPSSSPPKLQVEEKKYVTKQGFKRTISDDDENTSFKRKKISHTSPDYNVPHSTSGAKNLANNRLKKLKESIQAELKSKNINSLSVEVSPGRKLVDKALNEDSCHLWKNDNTKNLINTTQTIIQNYDNSIDKKLPEFIIKNNSPNQLCKKNIANERFNLIKKKINQDLSKNTSSIQDITSEVIPSKFDDPHCSKVKTGNEKITTKLKRSRSNTTNDSNKSETSLAAKRLIVSRNVPLDNETRDCDINVSIKNNGEKPQYNLSTDKPVPQKLSSPNSDKYSKVAANSQNINICQESVSHLSPLLRKSNSFADKMAMTASWIIKNYQDVNKRDSSLDKEENSLSVNVDDSSYQIRIEEDTEDMEWTNAEPDDQVIDPNKCDARQELNKKDQEKSKDVCLVVDTNVFISGLSKIRDIMDLKVAGTFKPLIYIPWMVMTELDYMKDSCSDVKLKKNITNSIKFINNALKEEHPRLIGQTVFEAEKQKYVGPSPDDKIISCCIQVAEKYESVILVSNDINLKNKAMINNLTACSTNEIMIKIMLKLGKSNKSQKIIHKMGIMCSSIICECAKEAYGNVWSKMDMLSSPPWSLVECLKRFKKYWGSVFREKILKQFTKTMQEMLQLLESNKCIFDDSEDFVQLMKLCVTLCIFLKDLEAHRGLVENTLNDIRKLA